MTFGAIKSSRLALGAIDRCDRLFISIIQTLKTFIFNYSK